MKSYKTTIIGLALAISMAVQPIFDAGELQFDKKTIGRFLVAVLVAIFGYLAKDHDVTGK